jgi:tripartite-type tricarboxylate transporter receptor subunit TctC
MKQSRRNVLRLAAAVAAWPMVPRLAVAQAYPSRPVRMIVGFAAGSAPDIIARLLGQWLSEGLGQPFVIDNRPGAASNIATEAAVKSAPDGYTVQMTVLTNVFNTTLYSNLNFNFVADVAHVAGVANAPYVMIVPPSFPAKTVAEFIAYAKANPGKINMASGGKGSSSHIFGELFKAMAGVDLLHVPYRGVYMTDLIAGQVHVVINPIPQALALIRDGKLRALGVTSASRKSELPDTPTMVEAGVLGFTATLLTGIVAPAGTPAAVVGKLNGVINETLKAADMQELLIKFGSQARIGPPQDFASFLAGETRKWADIAKAANVSVE